MSKVKTKPLSRDIGSCLMNSISKDFSKTSKHEVTSRMKCCCLDSIICKSSFEFSDRSCSREFLMFLECSIESFGINCKSLLFCKLYSHLKRKTKSIEKCKCLATRNLCHLLSTSLKCNLESVYNLFKFSNSVFESLTELPFFQRKLSFYFICIIFYTVIDS